MNKPVSSEKIEAAIKNLPTKKRPRPYGFNKILSDI